MPVTVSPSPTGALVVTFSDVNPPVRADGVAWVTVEISEASSSAGPWTVIDSHALSPVDSDPSAPQARTFTTTAATIEEGFYTLTFIDSNGGSSHPIEQAQDVPSQIRPSLSDLGSFMRSRTVVAGTGGTELGTFNDQTRPTDTEALALIQQATNYVLMEVGEEIPDRMILQARFLVVLYAAQLVELTFYGDEVNHAQSAYSQYAALYQQGARALQGSLQDTGPAAPQAAFYSVPVLNQQQGHWQAIFAAIDPKTGRLDPSKLPPEEYWPMGLGGIPFPFRRNQGEDVVDGGGALTPGFGSLDAESDAPAFDAWSWLLGFGLGDTGLAFLED